MTSETGTKLTLLPKHQDTSAELCWNEPENARKKYAVEGIGSFQGRHYKINGQPYLSVTKILDLTIPKPALVPWARNVSLEAVRLTMMDPLRPFDEVAADSIVKGGWEEYVNQVIEAARNRPDAVRDEAADWGTGAHRMLQQHIDLWMGGNLIWDSGPTYGATMEAFAAFASQFDIQWLATELVLWDDFLKVAGTVDAVGRTKEGLVVFDWKTGNAIYPEAALQVSAYAGMIEELYDEPVARAYVVRFPREQPEPVKCARCNGGGHYGCVSTDGSPWCGGERFEEGNCLPCADCNGHGAGPAPLFEVQEIASIVGNWAQFENQVAQVRWSKTKVWRE